MEKINETSAPRCGPSLETEIINGENQMLKFLGGTVGIIFIIGLIVVIALFKLVF